MSHTTLTGDPVRPSPLQVQYCRLLQRTRRHPRAERLEVLRRPDHQANLQAAQPSIYRVRMDAEMLGKRPVTVLISHFLDIGSESTVRDCWIRDPVEENLKRRDGFGAVATGGFEADEVDLICALDDG